MIGQPFCHRRCSFHPFFPSQINSYPKWLVRLDKIIPSLEKIHGMSMPPQDLAAIHALAHESSQWIANCEVQPLNICRVDLSTWIDTEQLHYFYGIPINNTLHYFDDSSVLSLLTDLCILQVWVRNQYRIRFSTNSAIWWRLKKTINAEEALLEWIPIIGSEYRNWWIDRATPFYIIEEFYAILCSSFSFMMAEK